MANIGSLEILPSNCNPDRTVSLNFYWGWDGYQWTEDYNYCKWGSLILSSTIQRFKFGFENQKFRCAYVILLMATYWMLELLPLAITSLLPVVLLPLLGVESTCEYWVVILAALYCSCLNGVACPSALFEIVNEITLLLCSKRLHCLHEGNKYDVYRWHYHCTGSWILQFTQEDCIANDTVYWELAYQVNNADMNSNEFQDILATHNPAYTRLMIMVHILFMLG